MFKRIRPEKVAGIVALSYLVLIPVGAALVYRKVQIVEQDLQYLYDETGTRGPDSDPLVNTGKLKQYLGL